MANTAHDQASGDAQVDRGTARRTASQHTPLDFPTMASGGVSPDRRAANDRRRITAKAIPMRMAGNALGWATLIAAMTAANLAALLVFSSILQF
ncbi:MAG: hypothetical protein HOB82_02740 [Alphaproteobacteria bacterium]|jgi:hypothetical protein|nr:hypothetical protein [Alphaproteobacteria bacterium]MBT5859872.1 hypothetical protein [Alphaproteobacteria bacterium]